MRKTYLFLLALLFTSQAFALNEINILITGNIIDENENAIAFANVALENTASKQLQGTISDDKGYFNFGSLKDGSYKLKITFLGYASYESEVINISGNNKFEFTNIILSQESEKLSEVVITGRNIVSEIKPAQIKYKTVALISEAGGNAGDILKNMPSVSMGGSPGHNRDIRFRGLGNGYTKVLINGKEAGLKGNNHEAILDLIPAGSIESIEILSVPGAEYNSEGINGVINIVLKENNKYGTHGSAVLHTGNYDGLAGDVSLSHKTEKLNLFAQYNFQQRTLSKTKESLKTSYNGDGSVKEFENKNENELKSFNNRFIRTGFSYNILPKTKFSAEYQYGDQTEDKTKNTIISKLKSDESFKSAQNELKPELKLNNYHRLNTSVTHTFNNKQLLSVDFSYLNSLQEKTDEKSIYNIDETGRLMNFQPKLENKNEYRTTDDYSWGISLKNINILGQKINIGYAGINEINNFSVSQDKYSYSDTAWKTKVSGYDNFNLDYTVHSFYVTDEFNYTFLRIKSGLRYEYTKLIGNAQEGVNIGNGTYGILLPNVSFTANIDKSQYINLNFGRRIRRPGYKDLNPYAEEKEVGRFKQGNPDLMPELAWAMELGYFRKFDHFNFGTNVFYRKISNVIQKTISEDDNGIITEMPENTGSANLAGIEFMSAINIFDFWELNVNYSHFFSEITSGDYKGDALKDQFKWSAKAINDFKLPYKTRMQLIFNAVGPKVSNEKTENTIWFADLGIEKELTKGGSIVFRVSDVFNSLSKEKFEHTSKSSSEEFEFAQGRIFTLGLKYNF